MSSQDLFAPSSEQRRLFVQLSKEDLKQIHMNDDEIESFLKLRDRYLKKPLVNWPEVEPVEDEFFHKYDEMHDVDKERAKELLQKTVVVALNGGLGSRMGLKGAKAALPILTRSGSHSAYSFLEIKVLQIEALNKQFGVDIPLVLMNSFGTEEQSKKMIEKFKNRITIHTFLQSKFPLLNKDTLAPVADTQHKESWYPPGSGEVFPCLARSGLLEKFLKEGKDYIFISNVENIGATIDTKLLEHLASNKIDFMLEVTNRISTDEGGGTPIKYNEQVHILELPQIPYDHISRFGISTFKYWNTNNIWAKLKVVNNMLRLGAMDLDFVVKTRNIKGRGILSIETPLAMAIHCFKNKCAVLVPRSRHKQVKKTSQLLTIQSELFEIDQQGMLVMHPKRVPPTEPIIKLGEEFRELEQYEKRFKTLPNILELDHLTVSGNVHFGANVTLKGTVIIVAETGSRIDIPDNTVLENKIMSGSLIVLDY